MEYFYTNGVRREATPEELEEIRTYKDPVLQPTEQEQIDALRQENEDLWLAIGDMQFGGAGL